MPPTTPRVRKTDLADAFDDESRIQEAIEQLRKDIENGYHLVPFVGAGFSAAAGIPLVYQLLNRDLPYWILCALGLTKLGRPAWDVRSGIWPDLASELARVCDPPDKQSKEDTERKEEALKFQCGNPLQEAQKRINVELDSNEADENRRAVLVEARQVLGQKPAPDWRRMIEFLARLELSANAQFPRLGPVSDSVADSLFVHLSRHREPALSHRMLQSLSPVLRFRVLLTTNFDTLIEQAFSLSGTPLETFEVPRTARLPDASVVLARRSLIKLHGGRLGLRADASTDFPADSEDIRNFLSYLAGYRSLRSKTTSSDDRVAFLCSGMSAQDRRTHSLLLAALGHFSNLRIYWLSYTEAKYPPMFEKVEPGKVTYLRHSDHGLFLLQLYQVLNHTVPPSGVLFPGQLQLPGPPLISIPTNKGAVVRTFERHFHEVFETIRSQDTPPIAVFCDQKTRGGVTVCSNLCRNKRFLASYRVIWLDLHSIGRPVGVFVRLMLTLGRQQGEHDPQCYLDTDQIDRELLEGRNNLARAQCLKPVRSALSRSFARSGKTVVVLLNGQETPGSDSPFQRPPACSASDLEPSWDNRIVVSNLLRSLARLNINAACGARFVLLLRRLPKSASNKSDTEGDNHILANELTNLCNAKGTSKWKRLELRGRSSTFDPAKAAQAALEWVEKCKVDSERKGRSTFLRLLTLFRVPRYLAGLERVMASYFRIDDPASDLSQSAAKVGRWITELKDLRFPAVRRKPGGFIWMNSCCKALIRSKLDEGIHQTAEAMKLAAELHTLVARWYGRLLLSSIDPLAAVEGIHHALETTHLSIKLIKDFPDQQDQSEVIQKAATQLEHARSLLCTAKPLFQSRLSSQFACRSLQLLRQFAKHYIDCIAPREKRLSELRVALGRLYLDLWRDWSRLSLREGEYESCNGRAKTFWKEWDTLQFGSSLGSEARRTTLLLKIDEAGSHMYRRHYREAVLQFSYCWTDPQLEGPRKLCPELDHIAQSPPFDCGTKTALAWLRKSKRTTEDRILLARLARRWLYLLLMRRQVIALVSKIVSKSKRLSNDAEELCRNHLLWGLCYFDFASALLRAVPETSDGMVHEESVRLRVHAALCRGILEAVHGSTNSNLTTTSLADTMLTDAEAFIEEFPLRDNGRNLGLAYLRRAELAIIRVGSEPWFKEQRRLLRDRNVNTKLRNPGSHRIMALVSSVHDALHWIDRAEEQLRQQPKIRWWWWILIVLKTKACEYLYVLRVIAEQPHPDTKTVPFLPAAVSRFMDFDLLLLVDEKNLTDLFMLARIVFSYTQALVAKQYQAEKSDPLSQSTLRNKNVIKRRRQILNQLLNKGKRLFTKQRRQKPHDIESEIFDYWKAACQASKSVTRALLRS